MMTPKEQYLANIEQGAFKSDPAQAEAVDKLDDLYHRFMAYVKEPKVETKKGFFSQLFDETKWFENKKWLGAKSQDQAPPPQGLYFWGGVGRGKTYLMDLFFDALPHERKMRMHFHRFMQRVHHELGSLKQVQDPLEIVADRIKQETDIICFDEFFVSDITDAMLLGTLFQALFKRNMVLVATSNIPIQDLYRNGLQRARFMPAIEMLQTHCVELNVDGGIDYRLRTLEQATIYHTPLSEQVRSELDACFVELTRHEVTDMNEIEINHRMLTVKSSAEGVLYATFEQLCETPRSHSDFIELSRLYHTVILAEVKQMSRQNEDAARRFIALVDEFYERHVTLIISAQVALETLYTQGQLEFEFQRCQSRLIEMQSLEYLAREHLA